MLAAGVGLALWPATPAAACSCEAASTAVHTARAQVVFVGTAIDSERFAVESVHKGSARAEERVVTPGRRSSCDMTFVPGERYAVFGTRGHADWGQVPDRAVATHLCAGTTRLAGLPPGLGIGREPESTDTRDADPGWLGLALLAAVVPAVALASRR